MDKMDGKDMKTDYRMTGSMAEVLKVFKTIIEKRRAEDDLAFLAENIEDDLTISKKSKKKRRENGPCNPQRWDLRSVHLGNGVAAGRTMDDVYTAFLRWAQKPEDVESKTFNISKAERRFETFATFQDEIFDKYFTEPIDLQESHYKKISDLMGNQVCSWEASSEDRKGCLIWVFDFKTIDLAATKAAIDDGTVKCEEILRWLFGILIETMWDSNVQTHGVIIVEGLETTFRQIMKMKKIFDPIEDDMNKLFYQCMPFKMKELILVGTPWWISGALGLMRLFLSRKMRKRLINTNLEDAHRRIGGAGMLPKGVLGGTREYEFRYSPEAKKRREPAKKVLL